MFDLPTRDFVMIFCSPAKGHWLVKRYGDPNRLRAAIPHSDLLRGLPGFPMVGELSYEDIAHLLRRQRRYTRAEREIATSLANYLLFKARNLPTNDSGNQEEFPFPG